MHKQTVFFTSFENIHNERGGLGELGFLQEHLEMLPKHGDCTEEVKHLLAVPFIKEQIAKFSREEVRAELREYGAWGEEELKNHLANLARLVWVSAERTREEIASGEAWTVEIELDETGLLGDW